MHSQHNSYLHFPPPDAGYDEDNDACHEAHWSKGEDCVVQRYGGRSGEDLPLGTLWQAAQGLLVAEEVFSAGESAVLRGERKIGHVYLGHEEIVVCIQDF